MIYPPFSDLSVLDDVDGLSQPIARVIYMYIVIAAMQSCRAIIIPTCNYRSLGSHVGISV